MLAEAAFRFSYNVVGVHPRDDFAETRRRAERYGYDTAFAADHLGIASPFPALVAAAQATRRLRVGTLVLNAPMWNPALLARDIATTDVLTDGRLEVGLGAGHMKWEFDEAGIVWETFDARVDQLRTTIGELSLQFATDGYAHQAALRDAFGIPVLRPVQRRGFNGSGPPLIVGGTSDRVLRLAAEHADIVSVAGLFQVKGSRLGRCGSPTQPRPASGCAMHASAPANEPTGWSGTPWCRSSWKPTTAVRPPEPWRNAMGGSCPRGDPPDTVRLHRQHRTNGRAGTPQPGALFTYYTVHGPYMDAFAPVIERVRALGDRSPGWSGLPPPSVT